MSDDYYKRERRPVTVGETYKIISEAKSDNFLDATIVYDGAPIPSEHHNHLIKVEEYRPCYTGLFGMVDGRCSCGKKLETISTQFLKDKDFVVTASGKIETSLEERVTRLEKAVFKSKKELKK